MDTVVLPGEVITPAIIEMTVGGQAEPILDEIWRISSGRTYDTYADLLPNFHGLLMNLRPRWGSAGRGHPDAES